ncbi:hypothetical protein V8J88_22320 [Massilia sp. W12]|uniref:hypothetical protein n=1 Tax=Massilia sp. W12 TaxID=3126507 RepID=UPI0030CEC36C
MKKLHELISVRCGLTCRSALVPDPDGNLLLLQLKDAYPGHDWQDGPPIRVRAADLPRPYLLSAGDFIFRARGVRHFLLPAPVFTLPLACVSPLMSVRILDSRLLLPEYLLWYVNTDYAQSQLMASPHRTGRLQLRTRALLELELPLPSLPRQAEIVELFEQARAWSEREVTLAQHRLQQTTASLLHYAGET